VARKPKIETRGPHPVAKPKDGGERSRRDPVCKCEAVDPTRQQLVRKRIDGDRPLIADDLAISLADLDGEIRIGPLVVHSRPSRAGARRRFETGM
jgi:hypothetical protein